MPKTGLSDFYYAKYTANQGAVSYSGGGLMGRAVSYDSQITTNSSDFYADNQLAESDETFQSGTLTITTAELTQAVVKDILGVTEQALTNVPGITDTGAKQLIWDDDQHAAELGVGHITELKIKGVTSYRAIVLKRVSFAVPQDQVNTRGETIEWQTDEITGKIMRGEDAKHAWKQEATLTTHDQAVAFIKWVLNIDQPEPDPEQQNVPGGDA